ncbi:MAG: class I SAM-dependent methyltransferase [Deltaproteobacteria bacterium]|nr:class I SAM-dependent methyltransferase [Deltaproteobacteria bacterium]
MTAGGDEERGEARISGAEAFYGPLAGAASAARRVGWESEGAQALRIRALVAALGPLDAVGSVLDAGAGEGEALVALRAAGFGGRYVGEDILPAMVARAEARFAADEGATFRVGDAFASGADAGAAEVFDAVLCCGALNTALAGRDATEEAIAALTALWARTGETLAVELMVADRREPGARLARVDLAAVWAHARALAAAVSVREDLLPGEAFLVLRRSRRGALAALAPEAGLALARAEALLAAGEAEAARAAIAGDASPEARLVDGRALIALRRLGPAEAALRKLVTTPVGAAAELDLCAVLWMTGRRSVAEATLRRLAESSDDARLHLVELLVGKQATAEARAVVARIEDGLVRREAERLVGA